MSKKQAVKVFGRDEILAHVETKIENVEVSGWGGCVRIRPPNFQVISKLKLDYPDERDFQFALLTACMVDLQPDDVRAMMTGNGLRYAQLLDAVLGKGSPLNDAAVGKQ